MFLRLFIWRNFFLFLKTSHFENFFSSKSSFASHFQIEHFYFSLTIIDSFKKQTIKNDRRKNDFIDYSKLFRIEISSKRFTITRQKRFNNSFVDQQDEDLTIFDENEFANEIIVKSETELRVSVNQNLDLWYRRMKSHVDDWNISIVKNQVNMIISKQEIEDRVTKIMNRKKYYKTKISQYEEQILSFRTENDALQQDLSSLDLDSESDDFDTNKKTKIKFKFESHFKRFFEYSKSSIFIDDLNSLYENWKLKIQNKLNVNKNWWSTSTLTTRIIFIFISDKVSKHFNARRRHDLTIFVRFKNVFDALNEIFLNHDSERNARAKYNELKMKSEQFFAEFYSNFILLTNQLKNCIDQIKLKNLKNKISTSLTQATINNEFFNFLLIYKKHLQIIDINFNRRRFAIQFLSKYFTKSAESFIKSISRIDRTAKNIDMLLRMLFKSKIYINMKYEAVKNFVIKSKNSRNCWNCEESHLLIDCSDFSKKKKWIKKKFKQEIISLEKIDVSESNIQMINLIKTSSNSVDEINEFDSDVKRASKN